MSLTSVAVRASFNTKIMDRPHKPTLNTIHGKGREKNAQNDTARCAASSCGQMFHGSDEFMLPCKN